MTVLAPPSAALRQRLRRATVAAAREAAELGGNGDPSAMRDLLERVLRTELHGIESVLNVAAGFAAPDEEEAKAADASNISDRSATEGPFDLVVDIADAGERGAYALPGALVAVAVAPAGAFGQVSSQIPLRVMVASGRAGSGWRGLDIPGAINAVARDRGVAVADVTVAVGGPGDASGIRAEVRTSGARECDARSRILERTLSVLHHDSEIDLVIADIEGPALTVIAAAVRALGGELDARFIPRSRAERSSLLRAGVDLNRVLHAENFCSGPAAIFVSAITDCDIVPGALLHAVRGRGAQAQIWSWGA